MPITSVGQLATLLGDEFIILFGSAVSGANLPWVPMVPTFRRTLLELASEVLQFGTYSQRLLAEYALSLTPQGKQNYQQILETTKFETFLLRLTRIVEKPRVDDLLVRLYSCTENQYGPNHLAIAHLLRKRTCLAAFTTNFDNALELCYPDLTVLDRETKPLRIPTVDEPPWLLKLHGDAKSRTCIATSLELSQAKLQNRYSYLRNLLNERNVLVLGYGGNGDVDIAPQLWNLNAKLFWCIRSEDETNQDPRYLNRIDVVCDLSQPSTTEAAGSNPNLLLQLANQFGWMPQAQGQEHPWRSRLKQWLQTLSLDEISEFVLSLHSWNTNWPSVHVSYVRWLENKSPESEYHLTASELQISAYNSAEAGLRTALTEMSSSDVQHSRVNQQLGFVLWRKGRFQAALKTYTSAIEPSIDVAPSQMTNLTEVTQQAARQYLETVDEMMSYSPRKADRRLIFKTWQVAQVARYLSQVEKLLIEDEYLARIALLRIDYWIGVQVRPELVRELLDEAMAMEEWESAALTVQLLLLLTKGDAESELSSINSKLYSRNDTKLPRKNNAYQAYASRGESPIVLKALNGRMLMPFGIPVREATYLRRRYLWRGDYERALRA